MQFSWESLVGIGLALAMLGAALYKRASTRRREQAVRPSASGASKVY